MWQHSRMFGYDRDAGLMKVFIDEHLYKLFAPPASDEGSPDNTAVNHQMPPEAGQCQQSYRSPANMDNNLSPLKSWPASYYPEHSSLSDSIPPVKNRQARGF